MHTRRHSPTDLRERFLNDPDLSGAYIQALEKHRSIKLPYMRYSRTERRSAPRQLRQLALLTTRRFRSEKRNSWWLPRFSDTRRSCLLDTDLAELPAPDTSLNTTVQQTLSGCHHTPSATALNKIPPSPTTACPNLKGDRPTLHRRSTLCGPLLTSSLQPNLGSPIRSCTSDIRLDPPLTPVGQIIRTPLHPPRIEKNGLKTPSCDQWSPVREAPLLDFGRPSSPDTCSPEESGYHARHLNGRFTFRNRPCVRRLSYPHIASSSYPFSSPLNMSGITNALNASHELASPLIIRSSSSIAAPCTPQIVKDRGPTHLQWSPHCLGCFA